MTDKPQDRDPLGLGWRLMREPNGAVFLSTPGMVSSNIAARHPWASEIWALWQRALELKAERDQWHGYFNNVSRDDAKLLKENAAQGEEIKKLRGLLRRARGHLLPVWGLADSKEAVRALRVEIDTVLGEGAMEERVPVEERSATGERVLKFTLKDLDADVARIAPAIQRALEDRLGIPAVEQDAKKDEGERLLKLAPEVPPQTGIEAMLRDQERRRQEYLRSFDTRLANLEEVTAALERRLDDLSLIRDKQQGSDD